MFASFLHVVASTKVNITVLPNFMGIGVYVNYSFFFFQAEDGIRDLTVTGVQTCALPIFDENPGFSQLGLVSVPAAGTYTIALAGTGTGMFDLGLVVPEGSQLRQVTYDADRKSVV